FTDWSGHGPREIEDQVTYPLALELQGLAGVRVVRSSSDVGYSMINVIFEDSVGWETARRNAGEALTRAGSKLPPGGTARLGPDRFSGTPWKAPATTQAGCVPFKIGLSVRSWLRSRGLPKSPRSAARPSNIKSIWIHTN